MTETCDPVFADQAEPAEFDDTPLLQAGITTLQNDERRRGRRARAVLLIGKVAQTHGELLCLVQDLSQFGSKIRTGTDLQIGTTVVLTLSEEFVIPAVVRWVRDGEAGLEFLTASTLLPETMLSQLRQRRRRHPRFTRFSQALLEIDGQYLFADLVNIGPGGAALTVKEPERIIQRMRGRLTIRGMDCLGVQIHWTKGNEVGLAFERPLGFAALNQWILASTNECATDVRPRCSPPSFSRSRNARFSPAVAQPHEQDEPD